MTTNKRPLQPLAGIRVLDLTRLLPGPWGTMLLGDLGAEVLKVERPDGGDNSRAAALRYTGPAGSESVYFATFNRNKRSIALDLRDGADKARFLDLAKKADVVVENFRPGGADRLGIGYEALREFNPRIIYCALTGYGQSGPRKHLPGHDLNIAGMSGLLQGKNGEAPSMPRILMGDYAGGAMVPTSVLAALVDRDRHGRGAFIDISMLDALISWTGIQLNNAFAASVPAAEGEPIKGWGGNPRYGIYRAKDGGYLTVSLLERRFWVQFCNYIGRADLIDPDERDEDRLTSHGQRGDMYRRVLHDVFLTQSRDEWVRSMEEKGIPIGPVLTPEEVYARSEAARRDWHFYMEFPRVGFPVPQMGYPFQITSSDGQSGLSARLPPPGLDESEGWSDGD